jgi:hypothetical protein
MRKSSQLRCTAANLPHRAAEAKNPLQGDRNFGVSDFAQMIAARRERSRKCVGWHQLKQTVPAA